MVTQQGPEVEADYSSPPETPRGDGNLRAWRDIIAEIAVAYAPVVREILVGVVEGLAPLNCPSCEMPFGMHPCPDVQPASDGQ